MKLCGVVTLGPKGQVVIPNEIRKALQLQPGDSLAMVLKDNKYIWLVRNEDMTDLMQYVEENK